MWKLCSVRVAGHRVKLSGCIGGIGSNRDAIGSSETICCMVGPDGQGCKLVINELVSKIEGPRLTKISC